MELEFIPPSHAGRGLAEGRAGQGRVGQGREGLGAHSGISFRYGRVGLRAGRHRALAELHHERSVAMGEVREDVEVEVGTQVVRVGDEHVPAAHATAHGPLLVRRTGFAYGLILQGRVVCMGCPGTEAHAPHACARVPAASAIYLPCA